MNKVNILSAIFALLVLFGCFFDNDSDGTAGNNGGGTEVIGILLLEDGETPAAGAVVEVYHVSDEPLSKLLSKMAGVPVAATTSNEEGWFSFNDLEDGAYNIKAQVSNTETLMALIQNVVVEEGKVRELGASILLPPGNILLQVLINTQLARGVECFIPGVTRVFSSDESCDIFSPKCGPIPCMKEIYALQCLLDILHHSYRLIL